MPTGQVIRSHSHIHYVLVDGREIECRPRGKFRLEAQRVLTGDLVEVTLSGPTEGRIDQVLPRRSELQRPPVANVDQVVVVFTLREPATDYRFLDRLLAQAEHSGVQSIIALNKIDLVEESEVAEFVRIYEDRVGYPVCPISAVTGAGLDLLRPALAGRASVLAGQSGVGKSRLLSVLAPYYQAPVGRLSEKLRRGRHTTRHVELIPLAGGGLVADAPGFTHLTFSDLEPRDLAGLFRDLAAAGAEGCRFDDCLHRTEPGCAVKAALERGQLLPHRYEHYLEFLSELESARKW